MGAPQSLEARSKAQTQTVKNKRSKLGGTQQSDDEESSDGVEIEDDYAKYNRIQ